MLKDIIFKNNTVKIFPANCTKEIKRICKKIIDSIKENLPKDKTTPILIKPNLNNDLNTFTGNSTDLRIIAGTVEALKNNRFNNIIIADGSNVGIDRRGINTFKRLRIDRLTKYYDIKYLNLNDDETIEFDFPTGKIKVSKSIIDSNFLITIPKLKTHAEALMSLAVKNFMGTIVGQEKRKMHENLTENLVRINEIVKPDLTIVDCIIAMEGNGPGDGKPKHLGFIGCGTDSFLIDLTFARLFGFNWSEVEYLKAAFDKGYITKQDIKTVNSLEIISNIEKPPKRGKLAVLSEKRWLYWLKLLVRPVVSLKPVTALAYKLKIIQDIYSLDDDDISCIVLDKNKCLDSCDVCNCFCPTNFIKVKSTAKSFLGSKDKYDLQTSKECIGCLYCYFTCKLDAIELIGEKGFLEGHIQKYK